MHLVPNGFDEEELEKVKPFDFGHFAIIYAGIFYPPKRVITPIMAALKCLWESSKEGEKEWYFHYYGSQEQHVYEEACRYSVSKKVIIHGRVSRADALSAVKGANVAVVITSIDENVGLQEKGIVTGKVYEILGLQTPMLIIAPEGGDIDTMTKATGLAMTMQATNIDGITTCLRNLLKGGQPPQAKDIHAYSWQRIGKTMEYVSIF